MFKLRYIIKVTNNFQKDKKKSYNLNLPAGIKYIRATVKREEEIGSS